MPAWTRASIITTLLQLFKDDGKDLSNSVITNASSLYKVPFGYNQNSLTVFLTQKRPPGVNKTFGVDIAVPDLGKPPKDPTYGKLVNEIVKQTKAQ